MKRIDAALAVVVRDGQVLICLRKTDDTFGGYWEFPGGKCEAGETLEQCLRRELLEELAIHVRPLHRLTTIEHDYPHVSIRLHPFICEHESGQIEHRECQTSRWVAPASLREHRFPPANGPLLEEIITHLAATSPADHRATASRE